MVSEPLSISVRLPDEMPEEYQQQLLDRADRELSDTVWSAIPYETHYSVFKRFSTWKDYAYGATVVERNAEIKRIEKRTVIIESSLPDRS